jgi:hypothetical protein
MALWGKIDNEASKPKYLSDELVNTQTLSAKDATIGVDVAEAQNATNRAKAIKTPGWTKYRTYTDGNGTVRHKAEILVAFGDDMTGDSDATGAAVVPYINITVQPLSATVVEDAVLTLSVTAATVNGTTTLAYQWQSSLNENTWTNVGTNSATYTVPTATDGTVYYRVLVSGSGMVTKTSSTATVVVTPAVVP